MSLAIGFAMEYTGGIRYIENKTINMSKNTGTQDSKE